MTIDYRDSNEYEVANMSIEDEIDPHKRVEGVPDDRMLETGDFVVHDELSATNI